MQNCSVVCSYLSHCADSGLKAGSIQRRVSAIAAAHSAAGQESPTMKTAVRLCLAGIRRALGVRQVGKAPAVDVRRGRHALACPVGALGPPGPRDAAGGLRWRIPAVELVALNVEDLEFTEDGIKVLIGRSKTDQEGAGQVVGIARGVTLCPVVALKAWLSASEITAGSIFRPVNRHGQLQRSAITDQVVALVVKRYATAAGMDARKYAGHSLRAGLVTSAAMNNVSEYVIQRQTRHRRTRRWLRKYIRDVSLFRDNASGRVGL